MSAESKELQSIRAITRDDVAEPVPDTKPICPACGSVMTMQMECKNDKCEMFSA